MTLHTVLGDTQNVDSVLFAYISRLFTHLWFLKADVRALWSGDATEASEEGHEGKHPLVLVARVLIIVWRLLDTLAGGGARADGM